MCIPLLPYGRQGFAREASTDCLQWPRVFLLEDMGGMTASVELTEFRKANSDYLEEGVTTQGRNKHVFRCQMTPSCAPSKRDRQRAAAVNDGGRSESMPKFWASTQRNKPTNHIYRKIDELIDYPPTTDRPVNGYPSRSWSDEKNREIAKMTSELEYLHKTVHNKNDLTHTLSDRET